MKIHFWGVRGSVPAPLTSVQVQNRISAVVERITPRDIVSADARESFLARLPEWLYSTVGGNTSCVEVTTEEGATLVFDAGSGLRELGKKIRPDNPVFYIFMSHFHWDHIQGLPFFGQAYNKNATLRFYSPDEKMEEYLTRQMTVPYFPVPMTGPGGFTAAVSMHTIVPGTETMIGNVAVSCKKMKHPGGSYSYALREDGKKFIYATDVELTPSDFEKNDENIRFFSDADVLVLDSQYTMEEAVEKENWGHSPFSYAIDFALFWGIKKLYLFHHEPTYDDR